MKIFLVLHNVRTSIVVRGCKHIVKNGFSPGSILKAWFERNMEINFLVCQPKVNKCTELWAYDQNG